MAKKKIIKKIVPLQTADGILEKIYIDTHYNKQDSASGHKLFISGGLSRVDDFLKSKLEENRSVGNSEWQALELSKTCEQNEDIITLCALPQDTRRYKKNLQTLEQSYIQKNTLKANDTLGDLVLHGQELLRRKYLARLCEPGKSINICESTKVIIETGASAIQMLGKAPGFTNRSFVKFSSTQKPDISGTGIEILSSGAFIDWTDDVNRELRDTGLAGNSGFENVIEAALDTPRSHAIARAIKQNKISPSLLPMYLRTMLDLELMRLGQATTPGTFTMLLNSYYYGARIVDHSTNVSEQVQIIYEEENWKPAWEIKRRIRNDKQAGNAAEYLVKEFYRFKDVSPVNKDHKRTARIQFDDTIDDRSISSFFNELFAILDKGKKVNGRTMKRNMTLHGVIPVLKLNSFPASAELIKEKIKLVKKLGFSELYLMAEFTKHYPGLLQYFSDAKETNSLIKFSKSQSVKLLDGRTVDMVATSNKTIEAAAGAIMSGQGCIKVGLLGLSYEQMFEFIKYVKDGLDSKSKRQGNQLLVFIGLVDEPIVSENEVYTDAKVIAEKFIDLMRRRQHDILLLDTMHKGKNDKRLVSEKDMNRDDTKGGHVTFNEMKKLILKSHNARCDLWVAGSYTEAQVYQASREELKYRPGLICLGGAERSFGGIRLDPSDAYEPYDRSKEERRLSAMVQIDSDIQFILSRDNKLARDTGHIEGELRRSKKGGKANALKKMRDNYLKIRKNYFDSMHKAAIKLKFRRRNMDILILGSGKIISGLIGKERSKLAAKRNKYESARSKYAETVSGYFYEIHCEEWFGMQDTE